MLTRSALIYLSRQEGLKEFAARFSLFRKLTTRFIAGETIDEAIAAIALTACAKVRALRKSARFCASGRCQEPLATGRLEVVCGNLPTVPDTV